MTKREQERAARIETSRREFHAARAALVAAHREADRLEEVYHTALEAFVRLEKEYNNEWGPGRSPDPALLSEKWKAIHAAGMDSDQALKATFVFEGVLSQISTIYHSKKRKIERDEAREAARIARLAERAAQKQQEPKAVALREKKSVMFREGLESLRNADTDDFYL